MTEKKDVLLMPEINNLSEQENAQQSNFCEMSSSENQPIWIRMGDFVVNHLRTPTKVSRKKYIILALTCGWFCGAHRWYAGEKGWAVVYLLTFWTGFAAAMTIVDLLLLWLKYEPDDDGMITI